MLKRKIGDTTTLQCMQPTGVVHDFTVYVCPECCQPPKLIFEHGFAEVRCDNPKCKAAIKAAVDSYNKAASNRITQIINDNTDENGFCHLRYNGDGGV